MNSLTAGMSITITPAARVDRDLGAVPYNPEIRRRFSFLFGTGAAQINQMHDDYVQLAAGGTLNISLHTGGLVNFNGEAINMTKGKGWWIENLSGVSSCVVRSNGTAASAFFETTTSGIILRPKTGFFLATEDASAYAMTGTNNSQLRFENLNLGAVCDLGFLFVGSQ